MMYEFDGQCQYCLEGEHMEKNKTPLNTSMIDEWKDQNKKLNIPPARLWYWSFVAKSFGEEKLKLL